MSKVEITLEEYDNYVIHKYEQGKLKETLTQEINGLKETRNNLLQGIDELYQSKNGLLDAMFKHSSMGSDTRREQTDITDKRTGSYAGFNKDSVKYLRTVGFTTQKLLDYINAQWDIREQSEVE